MYSKFNNILLKLAELSLKKRELLQSKYPNINLSELEQCDPTPTSEYINWIIKLYLNQTIILPEDQSKIYSALKRYTLGKKENKFPQQYKDINVFKTYGELAQALDQYLGKDIGEIKVMEGYNNSKVLYNKDGWEVVYVNDVSDLVNLSQRTKWCVQDKEYAEKYLKDGVLYLINRNHQRYCLIHPDSNQMKNVYDAEFRGKEEKEILDLLILNNIIPIDDIITIIIKRKLLNEDGYERYKPLALEKGKNNSDIAYRLLNNYKTELNNKQKEIYVKSAIKKANNAYNLLINYIITREEDGQLFFDLRKPFTTKDYFKKYGYYEYETYELLKKKIITREDGQLFFDAREQFIDEDSLEDIGHAYNLLINNIITREDGQLFINTSNSAMKLGNAYNLLENKIIIKEDGKLFYDCVNKVVQWGGRDACEIFKSRIITREDGQLFFNAVRYLQYDYRSHLLKFNIITEEDVQIAQGLNPNQEQQQPQENIEEQNNNNNQPTAKIINKLFKQSQLLKEKEKIDYDIVLDIATEVFENITANIYETIIFDSHVIKNHLIDLSINVLGFGFNGKLIQTDYGFKIIIGNISKHLDDHQRLLKFIYSILVHEITHISDILNDKYFNEEPEDLKEYVNSENERIAYMNQIIRECISYMNDLSPKLLAERIKLNDGNNDFIVNEILKSSETFMEIKNIINSNFMSQLKKSIKYLIYKLISD